MFFYGVLVFCWGYVDEVDDDQVVDVMQVQLVGDFFGCFQVGLQGGFFDVVVFGGVC